jgi:hypothetical protein
MCALATSAKNQGVGRGVGTLYQATMDGWDDVIARAKDNIARARRSAVILAFMAGAAAMVGAVVAWFAGWAGGEQRDGRAAPHMLWDWGRRVRRS